jgi:hypothetical protein
MQFLGFVLDENEMSNEMNNEMYQLKADGTDVGIAN